MHLKRTILQGVILLAASLLSLPAMSTVESMDMESHSHHNNVAVGTLEKGCECGESCDECRGCSDCLSLSLIPHLHEPSRYLSDHEHGINLVVLKIESLILLIEPPPPRI